MNEHGTLVPHELYDELLQKMESRVHTTFISKEQERQLFGGLTMILTVEIPDNAKNVKVSVMCDGKQYQCQEARYAPGRWNGINGGVYYCQYFDMEDENRVREMTEVASALNEYKVAYTLSKLKKQYRIMITNRDYKYMDEDLKKRIWNINVHHDSEGELKKDAGSGEE